MAAPPQFCPWCGTPVAWEPHHHEARVSLLAEQQGLDDSVLPERIRDLLGGESFVAACPGCRTLSHVVGHRPPAAEPRA